MNTYYYTFGTDPGFPYQGGWVQVYAETPKEADELFRKNFPDRHDGFLNCAGIYRQETFPKHMFLNGNYGKYCHKVLKEKTEVDQFEKTDVETTVYVPFAYQQYGRIPVKMEMGDTSDILFQKAEEILENLSEETLNVFSSYLADSEQIDYDGIILDNAGNALS